MINASVRSKDCLNKPHWREGKVIQEPGILGVLLGCQFLHIAILETRFKQRSQKNILKGKYCQIHWLGY
jgi:hypothetical protein